MSVPQFLNYLQIRNYSPRTIEGYKRDINEYFNALPMLSENRDTIKNWYNSLTGKPNSINRKLNAVKSYYNFCVKFGLMDRNPVSHLRLKKVTKSLPKFIPNMLSVLSEHKMDQTDFTVIRLLWETGMRVSELSGLTFRNVHEDHIRVTGKGDKVRIIPIMPDMYRLLSEHKDVFELKVHQIQYIVKKHLNVFPHTLRHTFATDLINGGANIIAIQKLLGHSSPETTERYTHINYERLKKIHEECFPKRVA